MIDIYYYLDDDFYVFGNRELKFHCVNNGDFGFSHMEGLRALSVDCSTENDEGDLVVHFKVSSGIIRKIIQMRSCYDSLSYLLK